MKPSVHRRHHGSFKFGAKHQESPLFYQKVWVLHLMNLAKIPAIKWTFEKLSIVIGAHKRNLYKTDSNFDVIFGLNPKNSRVQCDFGVISYPDLLSTTVVSKHLGTRLTLELTRMVKNSISAILLSLCTTEKCDSTISSAMTNDLRGKLRSPKRTFIRSSRNWTRKASEITPLWTLCWSCSTAAKKELLGLFQYAMITKIEAV